MFNEIINLLGSTFLTINKNKDLEMPHDSNTLINDLIVASTKKRHNITHGYGTIMIATMSMHFLKEDAKPVIKWCNNNHEWINETMQLSWEAGDLMISAEKKLPSQDSSEETWRKWFAAAIHRVIIMDMVKIPPTMNHLWYEEILHVHRQESSPQKIKQIPAYILRSAVYEKRKCEDSGLKNIMPHHYAFLSKLAYRRRHPFSNKTE